jgi:dienelactone hydrolase
MVPWISAVGVFLLLAGASGVAIRDAAGPARAEALVDGSIPVSVHLPRPAGDELAFREAPASDRLPPVVVLMHGYAGDRVSMSGLARMLTQAGYAVVTFDAAGHGRNRNGFDRSRARPDAFFSEFEAVVEFARAYPFVDGSRVAVGGHSMGAVAALDFASRDSGLDATLLISGGSAAVGPYTPANVLLIVASGDFAASVERMRAIAAGLAADRTPALGRTLGDFDQGTALRMVEIADTGHMTVGWARATAAEIVRWLDAAFRIEREEALAPSDPRLPPLALAVIGLLLALPGLGYATGRLAPELAEALPGGALALAALFAALLAALPFVGTGSLLWLLSVAVLDDVGAIFLLAGVALCAGLALGGRLERRRWWRSPGRSLAAAGVATLAFHAALQPLTSVVHGAALTPERAWVAVGATLAMLPLTLGMALLLRRGGPLRASLFASAGRLVVIVALALGLRLGILEPVVLFLIGPLALVFLVAEIFASSVYATSRNVLVIGLVDAAWPALVLASVLPIRV